MRLGLRGCGCGVRTTCFQLLSSNFQLSAATEASSHPSGFAPERTGTHSHVTVLHMYAFLSPLFFSLWLPGYWLLSFFLRRRVNRSVSQPVSFHDGPCVTTE